MKHTQEKWEVASCNMGYYYVKPIFNSKCKTSKANAKLIASAPDLLEACKLSNRWFLKLTEDKDFVNLDIELCRLLKLANNIVEQAIAKAEGGNSEQETM